MADALIQKIEKDFLSCCICFDELKNPIGLPCLHGFCFECLDDWHKHSHDKTVVICPTCNKQTQVPEEGISGFPGHFLVKNLKETVHMEKTEEKLQNTLCSVCGKQAEVHCVNCSKHLCQQCQTHHNTFIKDHRVVTVEELQSGLVTEERRRCEIHDEQVRYYCETEEKQVCMDCISLKTCPIEHERVTLKEAAKKHNSLISDLVRKCNDNKVKLQAAVEKNNLVLQNLDKSYEQSKICLKELKEEYVQMVQKVVQKQSDEIDKIKGARVTEIKEKQAAIQSNINEIGEVCDHESKVNQPRSEYLITQRFPTLSKKLNRLSITQPVEADSTLGYLKFQRADIVIPSLGHLLQRERWKLCHQFPTAGLTKLEAVTSSHDGNIAVASFKKGIEVYDRDGKLKCSFLGHRAQITGITVSHDNRYIVSNGIDLIGIEFYDGKGNHLSRAPVCDVNNKLSNLNSVSIDAHGRIIVGLVQNTISIHYTDGSLISKFATQSKPLRLAVTTNEEIVCSFRNPTSLKLMDYCGSHVREIQPPPKTNKWLPGFLCCTKGELFVTNQAENGPTGIYRYTPKGEYLDCVTTEVSDPRGIALSDDARDLFVVERTDCLVKIFHRE